MRHWIVVVVIVIAAACSKKKSEDKAAPAATAPAPAAEGAAPASGGADPWQAGEAKQEGGGGEDDRDDGEDGDGEAEPTVRMPSDDGGEVAAASAVERFCKRGAECDCPAPDCENFITKFGLADSVIDCFAKEPCESLCAKDSGAPGSTMYKSCMEGKVPTGNTGGARKSCQRDTDCPGQHDCCNGFCYQMGTSLWITACQMPSGRF